MGEVVASYFTATSTTATSTFANGIYITSGCFRGSDGNCIAGGSGNYNATSVAITGGTISGLSSLNVTGDTILLGDLTVTGNVENDIAAPTLLCETTNLPQASDIAINGNIAYVPLDLGAAHNTVATIAIVDKTNCNILGYFSHPAIVGPHTMIYHAGFLYLQQVGSLKQNEIVALDVRHGPMPQFASSVYTVGYAGGKVMQAYGNLLITNSGGLNIWDISNPYNIRHLSVTVDGGTACGGTSCLSNPSFIDCIGGYCYLGGRDDFTSFSLTSGIDGTATVKIMDVLSDTDFTNFSADTMHACTNTTCFMLGMTTNGSLTAVNISNPKKLVKINTTNTLNTKFANSWYLSGDVLYAGEELQDSSFAAFDVSSPTNPSLIYRFDIGETGHYVHRIFAEGNKLYALERHSLVKEGSLKIYESNGIKSDTGHINELSAGNLTVNQNAIVHRSLSVHDNIDVGGSITTSGELSAGSGFKVRGNYNFAAPSLSLSVAQTIEPFFSYDNLLYAGGSDAKLRIFGSGITAGKAWEDDANLTAIGGGTYSGISIICEFNSELYVGMGTGAGKADLYRCSNKAGGGSPTVCDSILDFSSAGLDLTNEDLFYGCLGWHGHLYVSTGYSAGEGDVRVCSPEGGGTTTVCDNAADWSVTMDEADAIQSKALVAHGNYLYAGFSDSSTALIRICDDSANGHCTWSTALTTAAVPESTRTNSLLSSGGCLYAGLYGAGSGGDIWRCCDTSNNGKCDNSTAGEWVKYADYSAANVTNLTEVEGKIVAHDNNLIFSVDNNSDLGTASKTTILDLGSSAPAPNMSLYTYKNALWIGTNNLGAYTMPFDNGFVSDYRGDTTAGNGLASIVGYVYLTGQTATKTETNIVIPPADGLYRVSVTQQVTTAGSTGNITTTARYTDATNTARTVATGALNCNAVGTNTTSQIIQAQAVDPISYDATEGSSCDGTWATYIIVERLN